MRLLVFALVMVVARAKGADAEPTHLDALATGGFWITGHGYGEKQVGAEVALDRDLGDIYRVGVGTQLDEYKIDDDECFGSTGQFAGAFATGGLREPTAKTVHLFFAARLGIRGARMVSACYPRTPIRYDAFTFGMLAAGFDVGDGPTRLRMQVSVGHSSVPNEPVEVGIGLGVSF